MRTHKGAAALKWKKTSPIQYVATSAQLDGTFTIDKKKSAYWELSYDWSGMDGVTTNSRFFRLANAKAVAQIICDDEYEESRA